MITYEIQIKAFGETIEQIVSALYSVIYKFKNIFQLNFVPFAVIHHNGALTLKPVTNS